MDREQNEFKLVRILNKYFPDILLETLSECANEIIQAGYLPIQAGEDGLAKNPYIELIGGFNEIKPTMFDKLSPVDQIRMMGQKEGYEQGRKAQKALDESQAKQKQAEAVKRITDKINASEQAIEILTEGLANAEVDLMKIKYNLEWLDKARDYVVNRVGIENNFKVFLLSILNYSNIDCWMENITDKDLSIEQSVKEAIETNIEDACR